MRKKTFLMGLTLHTWQPGSSATLMKRGSGGVTLVASGFWNLMRYGESKY